MDLPLPPPWQGGGRGSDGARLDLDRLLERLARPRRRGTYCTPPHLADWLLTQILPHLPPGATLLDPACGAGIFLCRAAALRPDLRLHGIDVDPVAVLAARMRLVLAAGFTPDGAAAAVRTGDFLLDAPAQRVDAVVGNPPWGLPYGRAERLALAAAGHLLDPGELCSAALFLRAAAGRVGPGGRVAFVLPESWLATRRAAPLRRWLLTEVRLETLAVLRKQVFRHAPDMVPVMVVVVVVQATPPSDSLPCAAGEGRGGGRREAGDGGGCPAAAAPDRVVPALSALDPALLPGSPRVAEGGAPAGICLYRHGLRRPLRPDGIDWQSTHSVPRQAWLAEPFAVFAVGTDPELEPLWQRLARLPRLGEVATLHDGVYKSHLLPLLAPGEQPVLLSAKEVTRAGIRHAGATAPAAALDHLPAPERARQQSPKLLLHAMRKPALADRLVAAADPDGRYLASNNFLLLIPRPGAGWPLPALAALLNSRLVNRWFADRYLQVNIEAFAVASLPLPSLIAPAELVATPEPNAVDDLVYRLYGAGMAERVVVARRWAGEV